MSACVYVQAAQICMHVPTVFAYVLQAHIRQRCVLRLFALNPAGGETLVRALLVLHIQLTN